MPGLLKHPLRRRVAAQSIPLSSLPIGAVIRVPVQETYRSRWETHMDFVVADQSHQGYPAGCTTLITEKIIQFLPLDACESDNPNAARAAVGNNRYIHSNIHQYFSSSAPAGQWYTPMHPYDAPPSLETVWGEQNAYDHLPGFLAVLPASFVGRLLTTGLKVLQCAVDGGGMDTFQAKVFLPCAAEMGFDASPYSQEGIPFGAFGSNEDRLAYPTAGAVESNDYKHREISPGLPYMYALRTPFLEDTLPGFFHSVGIDGTLFAYAGAVYPERAIRPVCNLAGSTAVHFLEAEGVYTLPE